MHLIWIFCMTLEEIRKALQDRRPSVVAKGTGLHRNIVAAVRDGRHRRAPSKETQRRLREYLEGRQ